MGFFDFLTGKKDKQNQPTPAAGGAPPPKQAAMSAWKAELQAAKKQEGFDWDFKSAPARQLVTGLLTRAAPVFGGGQVKELPDDGNIDLRGSYDGAPVRFAIWMSFGSFWAIEMLCENRIGELEIQRDHDKIPKGKDASDPWSKDEERRVFVAKGIFVEGRDQEVAEKLGVWSKLPDALRENVVTEMERLNMNAVRSYTNNVSFNVKPKLRDLDDPIEYMTACARLLAELKNALAQGDRAPLVGGVQIRGNVQINGVTVQPNVAPDAGAAAVAMTPLTCKYCSSLFILAAGKNACPNCGAAAGS
jgi:hypothetical protein